MTLEELGFMPKVESHYGALGGASVVIRDDATDEYRDYLKKDCQQRAAAEMMAATTADVWVLLKRVEHETYPTMGGKRFTVSYCAGENRMTPLTVILAVLTAICAVLLFRLRKRPPTEPPRRMEVGDFRTKGRRRAGRNSWYDKR